MLTTSLPWITVPGVSQRVLIIFQLDKLTRIAAIIGVVLIGPAFAAERLWGWTPSASQLPKLRNISDLYWAYWSALHNAAGTRVSNLNKYIVYSIHNTQTDQIISRSVRSRGKAGLESWPGEYFSIESTQGLALLGEFSHNKTAMYANHV